MYIERHRPRCSVAGTLPSCLRRRLTFASPEFLSAMRGNLDFRPSAHLAAQIERDTALTGLPYTRAKTSRCERLSLVLGNRVPRKVRCTPSFFYLTFSSVFLRLFSSSSPISYTGVLSLSARSVWRNGIIVWA